MHRVFILSPAKMNGERARMILSSRAKSATATQLRSPRGIAIGQVFASLSGLYFRGKYAYAGAFAKPVRNLPGSYVITPNRGLMPVETAVVLSDLEAFGAVPIDPADSRYARPLRRDAKRLAGLLQPEDQIVFLGSISTSKYVDLLLEAFGERLLFPKDFVGRGDMSRGGLLLRAVASGQELEYAPLDGAVRRGKRPPKLQPIRRA